HGVENLKTVVDTLITIPNQRLLSMATERTTLKEAFRMADEVLLQAVKGVSDLINDSGQINVDFADVRTIMANKGVAMMGIGSASGDHKCVDAAQKAISSPLLDDVSIAGATSVLINVTGNTDLTLYEVHEASSLIQEEAHEDAHVIWGLVYDDSMEEEARVTVIATGFEEQARNAPTQAVERRVVQMVANGGRGPQRSRGRAPESMSSGFDLNSDDYDIPTFFSRSID
ncbi:MAG: cell division protein FtsZ, partial [Proteobacteria bacterium]|nr:cell division protein FtsZ [Pseudomonadota bacterium]